jgi:glyoxylase-like metal-dependent hydrolase (beta-lactamase superfamily II)
MAGRGLADGGSVVIFRPFYAFETGCAAYVFGCGSVGLGAVVDPRERDLDEYVAFATAKGLRISHVFETHVHADHASGGRALAARTGAVYALHRSADLRVPFEPLDDGQRIELGNTRIDVLHTPGHTPESVSLLVTDLRRGPEPWFVLTGDTLFVGAVGRPDLPGETRKNAAQLYDSLHTKLLGLDAAVEVYPAHFSGSMCGAGMSGKPSSTIAFEKRFNPMLSLAKDAFVDALSDVPAKPADMQALLARNRGESLR